MTVGRLASRQIVARDITRIVQNITYYPHEEYLEMYRSKQSDLFYMENIGNIGNSPSVTSLSHDQ